ncbi:MAG: hypothetical protein KDH86_13700, partial [Anaerolineae bacterium]|nr:hypothetical protein [Anaerolineae bacterium]
VPGQVREVLERRVQGLQPAARQVLEAGAVLGARHDFALLQAISGRDGLETADGLDELVARQMLDPLPAGFQFHHDLIRATAYERMSSWRRRLLHSRAADALEERLTVARAGTKPKVDEIEFQEIDLVRLLAEQHIESGNETRAAPYLLEVGKHAAAQYAYQEAIDTFAHALALTPDQNLRMRWEILAESEAANNTHGKWQDARRNAESLVELANQIDDLRLKAISHQRLGYWLEITGDYQKALMFTEQAISEATAAHDTLVLAGALRDTGRLLTLLRDIPKAKLLLNRALELFRREGSHQEEGWTLIHLAGALAEEGYPSESERTLRSAIGLAGAASDPHLEMRGLDQLAFHLIIHGEYLTAQQLLDRINTINKRLGITYKHEWRILTFEGAVAIRQGAYEEGLKLLRQAYVATTEKDFKGACAYVLSYIGEAQIRSGTAKEAVLSLNKAREMLAEIGLRSGEIVAKIHLAEAILADHRPGLALELIRENLDHIMDTDHRHIDIEEWRYVPYIAFKVLVANDDPRANLMLEHAYSNMHMIANRLEDDEKRRMFLENVPWHREITAAWEAMQTKQALVIDHAWANQMNLETVKPV